jgi:cell wall-associated NlpC family hydrolase
LSVFTYFVKMDKKPKLHYLFGAALVAFFLLEGCHSSKKATRSTVSHRPETTYNPARESPSGSNTYRRPKTHCGSNESASKENAIVNTYAERLGVSKSDITNYKLYSFIDSWYGTPYKYAGRSRSGIDCSDFVSLLLQSVYNIAISGAVTELYKQCRPIKSTQLQEGDLVFFKINKKSLSHVGVYLQNNKFVHASVHSGVVIDDLDEAYYKKYFRASGRVMK